MAANQCPHCGSKYITFSEKNESFEKTSEIYFCQSCKKNFTVDLKKASADGTWLMTVYSDKLFNEYQKVLEIYKTDSGFMINQKADGKFMTRKVTPTLKINYNQYTHTYYLWFSSFIHFNDSNGFYFTAEKVTLNPELTEAALKNEAMRIVHKGGNDFAIGDGYNETTLLQDIKAWFEGALGTSGSSSGGKGGCYVATCVYGSYDCPPVWTLRRYRDFTLAKSWYGRLFIRTYYAISPTLVKCFGKTRWFRNAWKPALDKMVKALQTKGVENTPYQDKQW